MVVVSSCMVVVSSCMVVVSSCMVVVTGTGELYTTIILLLIKLCIKALLTHQIENNRQSRKLEIKS